MLGVLGGRELGPDFAEGLCTVTRGNACARILDQSSAGVQNTAGAGYCNPSTLRESFFHSTLGNPACGAAPASGAGLGPMGVESSDAQRKGAVLHLNRGNSGESRGNYGHIRGSLCKFTRSHLAPKMKCMGAQDAWLF